jgi:hypothetical protein
MDSAAVKETIVAEVAIVGEYQRRTQKGTGRTEKTVLSGAAKNPRLLKACNITRKRDMGEFFFISVLDEIVVNIFTRTKVHNFWYPAGLKMEFYANFTLPLLRKA